MRWIALSTLRTTGACSLYYRYSRDHQLWLRESRCSIVYCFRSLTSNSPSPLPHPLPWFAPPTAPPDQHTMKCNGPWGRQNHNWFANKPTRNESQKITSKPRENYLKHPLLWQPVAITSLYAITSSFLVQLETKLFPYKFHNIFLWIQACKSK